MTGKESLIGVALLTTAATEMNALRKSMQRITHSQRNCGQALSLLWMISGVTLQAGFLPVCSLPELLRQLCGNYTTGVDEQLPWWRAALHADNAAGRDTDVYLRHCFYTRSGSLDP
jgi:hypothetical protein